MDVKQEIEKRLKAGKSQSALARELGVSRFTIYHILKETGRCNGNRKLLEKLGLKVKLVRA